MNNQRAIDHLKELIVLGRLNLHFFDRNPPEPPAGESSAQALERITRGLYSGLIRVLAESSHPSQIIVAPDTSVVGKVLQYTYSQKPGAKGYLARKITASPHDDNCVVFSFHGFDLSVYGTSNCPRYGIGIQTRGLPIDIAEFSK